MSGVVHYRIDLWAVFIFLGIVQAMFLSLFFLSKENRKIQSNLFHGFLLIVVACCILEIFLMYTGYIIHCFYLVDFSEPLSLLIGPFTFLMIISLIRGSIRKVDYLHLLPAVLYAFYLIPFLILPEDAKYNSWLGAYHPELSFRDFDYPYDADILGIRNFITEITIASIFIYAILCLVETYKIFRRKKDSFLKPKSSTLRILQWHVFQLFSSVVFIVIVKLNNPDDTGDHIFAGFIAITIYTTSFSVIRNSGFFKPAILLEQQKYKTSSLTEDQSQSILIKLKLVMETEKPFLQPMFSLPDLAQRLSISVHLLSQVINERMERTFFELLAEYRVEEAKRLLKEKMNLKVEEIAEQVGYHSKSSFNTVFKKLTGKTPSEFRSS
ncbi:MAG: AraC family transcriptional regulator [Cyclobacteriaceae bacterium]|nr:AraC family transcriptional regulator [Cyclobacteriaceae bacterium]